MIKKVLFIYYTQSGQLGEIIDCFSKSFISSGIQIETIRIFPEKDYQFPWKMDNFFETMPGSVLGIPVKLKHFEFKETKYDLIVLGFQPWFLSPSIPVNSLLSLHGFQEIIKNTPVVTVIGARNMWISAQERIKKILYDYDARLVGNIVFTDKHGNLTSLVTILYWMLTGKRDKYLGIFPKPGVSDENIAGAESIGNIVRLAMEKGEWSELQTELIKVKAVEVKPNLMFIETRGAKLFKIWADLIIKKKNKTTWLRIFKYYLLIALFIVAPFVLIINILIFRPFLLKNIKRKRNYFLSINNKSWKT